MAAVDCEAWVTGVGLGSDGVLAPQRYVGFEDV